MQMDEKTAILRKEIESELTVIVRKYAKHDDDPAGFSCALGAAIGWLIYLFLTDSTLLIFNVIVSVAAAYIVISSRSKRKVLFDRFVSNTLTLEKYGYKVLTDKLFSPITDKIKAAPISDERQGVILYPEKWQNLIEDLRKESQ